MKGYLLLLFLFLVIESSYATVWKKSNSVTKIQICPQAYVLVPALSPYSKRDFCIAKYEMKNVLSVATSQASSVPWGNISRDEMRAKCRGLGAKYDLISNNQWQSVARNIAATPVNWSSGVVGSGQLNRGHTDSTPSSALEASSDDNDACNGTGQTCSSTIWNSQRRTFVLSNGEVIWDFGGNAWEWVTNIVTSSQGGYANITDLAVGSAMQKKYGADSATYCSSPSTNEHCGFGYYYLDGGVGAVLRSGSATDGSGGVFRVDNNYSQATLGSTFSFRCIFLP